MASTVMKQAGSSAIQSVSAALRIRSYPKIASGTDIVSAAPNVSLQKARTWDEGADSKFSTTPIKDIFKDKKVVIFGLPEFAQANMFLLTRGQKTVAAEPVKEQRLLSQSNSSWTKTERDKEPKQPAD